VSTGKFTTNLQVAAAQLGATYFENATSTAVTTAATPLSPTGAPTAAPVSSSSSSSSNGLSGGAIAGIVIGVLAFLLGVGFAVWYFVIRERAASQSGPTAFDNPIAATRRSSVEILQEKSYE